MKRTSGMIQTSVLVSEEFFKLCKFNHIKFSEAIRVGISILLAERGLREYDNNLNLVRKLNTCKRNLAEAGEAYCKLQEVAESRGIELNGSNTTNQD